MFLRTAFKQPLRRFTSKLIDFEAAAAQKLRAITTSLEKYEGLPWFEGIDEGDGVSEINFKNGKTIALNKHYVYKQIWYAAPYSGADAFDWESGWKSKRTGLTIDEQLKKDLDRIINTIDQNINQNQKETE